MPAPQYKTFQINCPAGAVPVVVPMAGLQFAFLAASVNIQGVVAGFDSGSMAEWAIGIELGTKVSARLYVASNIAQVITVAVADGTATIRDSRAAPVGIQPISAADGAIVSLGTTTDAKVVSSDSNGTLIALTKGLLDKYLDDGDAVPADNWLTPMAGENAGTIQSVQVDTAGRIIVAGPTAVAGAAAGNPVQAAGTDAAGLVRRLFTDSSGRLGQTALGIQTAFTGAINNILSSLATFVASGQVLDVVITINTATVISSGLVNSGLWVLDTTVNAVVGFVPMNATAGAIFSKAGIALVPGHTYSLQAAVDNVNCTAANISVAASDWNRAGGNRTISNGVLRSVIVGIGTLPGTTLDGGRLRPARFALQGALGSVNLGIVRAGVSFAVAPTMSVVAQVNAGGDQLPDVQAAVGVPAGTSATGIDAGANNIPLGLCDNITNNVVLTGTSAVINCAMFSLAVG